MKAKLLLLAIAFLGFTGFSQVGINNTDPKANLDISATNTTTPANTDGLLIPRIDDFPATDPTAAQQGMMVYLTTTSGSNPPGFYFWDNNAGPAAWSSVVGGTVQKINDLSDGKSDNDGSQDGSSIFIGIDAGSNDNRTDNKNVGIGFESLKNNTSGVNNTAIGYQSLITNTTGISNSANGFQALNSNLSGSFNTGIGNLSLTSNSSGSYNTGVGSNSLSSNTTGVNNTGIGSQALTLNNTGTLNTAIGGSSLSSNTSGYQNTAIGNLSLTNNTFGYGNVATGVSSLRNNTAGDYNTAFGHSAGINNVLGNYNVFLGANAGFFETGSNKLYIEGALASVNPLIYGEFDNDILRINGEFQVDNPAGTGYALPLSDGTVNQVLSTDGSGQISFVDISSGDADWYEVGTSTAPNAITDDIFTQGKVAIGTTTPTANYNMTSSSISGSANVLIGSQSTALPAMEINIDGAGTNGLFIDLTGAQNGTDRAAIETNNTQLGLVSSMGFLDGNPSNTIMGFRNEVTTSGSTYSFEGVTNRISGTSGSKNTKGFYNYYGATSTGAFYGFENNILGNGAGAKFGLYNSFGASSNGYQYGTYTIFNSTNSNATNRYGHYVDIPNTVGGTHYGIYADVTKASSYAAYFLGTVSIGTLTSNNYIFPSFRGSNGQIMQTNGSGTVSWVDSSTVGTDDQNISGSGLSGTNLTIGIESGSSQVVDLSSLQDADWYESGNTPPNSINDNVFTNGKVGINNSSPTGYLDIIANSGSGIGHIDLTESTVNDGARIFFRNASETTNYWTLYAKADNTAGNGVMNFYSSEVSTNVLRLESDGKVGIMRNPTTNPLEVEGVASKTTAGSWAGNSDRRLKKNILSIKGKTALDKINELRGVTYEWDDNKTGTERPSGIQYGFIAQELMKVFPEKVSKDNLGYYQTAYGDYDPLFVEAIKELYKKNEVLSEENKNLSSEISQLKNRLEKINLIEARLNALENFDKNNTDTANSLAEKK